MHDFLSSLIIHVKPFLLFALAGIVSVFSPIQAAMYVLGLAAIFNIVTGIVTDVHANKKDFCISKAFDAFKQLTFYFALVFFIHSAASSMQDFEVARLGVKWVTYIAAYYYATNILKNAKQVFPKNQALSMMYMILTTEVFLRMKEFLGLNSISKLKEGDQPNG